MPIPTQLVKPYCLVIGMERHTGLGLTPPSPVPVPNNNTFWVSASTAVLTPAGDWSSRTVKGHGSGIVKKGSDVKFLRPHVCLGSPMPPPIVPMVTDLGLIAVIIAFGSTKTIWGPFSVKADFEEHKGPAVIMIVPTMFFGPANQLVCSSPCTWPVSESFQPPNTVYAGMSLADVLGCLVLMASDILLDAYFQRLFKVGFIEDAFKWAGERAGKFISKRLGEAITDRIFAALASRVPENLGFSIEGGVKDVIEKFTETAISEVLGDLAKDGSERIAHTYLGKAPEHLADDQVEEHVGGGEEGGKGEGHGEGEGEGHGEGKGEGHGEGEGGHGEGKGEGHGEGEGGHSEGEGEGHGKAAGEGPPGGGEHSE